jgi:hypothetical protein
MSNAATHQTANRIVNTPLNVGAAQQAIAQVEEAFFSITKHGCR